MSRCMYRDSLREKRLKIRARIIQLIREFFIKQGFLEVETPILVPVAGQEPYLDPMKVIIAAESGQATIRRGLATKSRGGYLITSPEYSHKKLLAAGFKKTFEITKCFRDNEPLGGLHNPEFTMLEWYRSRADYFRIMEDVERIVQYVWQGLQSKSRGKSQITSTKFQTNSKFKIPKLKYCDKGIDLSSPWERITVREAFKRYASTRLENIRNDTDFFKIFLTHIEPKLGFPKPTILYEYPARMAALARVVTKPQRRSGLVTEQFAERFELYIAGIELANAFSELNDAKEQRKRFLQEQKLRKKLGKEIIPIDQDFLDAVGRMPPAAGIALGVDRLVMLLTNAPRIEDVLAFPALAKNREMV